ncbi:MAG: hypothetical protein MUE78_13210 [Ilumatobacteraceae bacterium]|nr:hypothetical protein [Ilumatobacteraceae bacterium]
MGAAPEPTVFDVTVFEVTVFEVTVFEVTVFEVVRAEGCVVRVVPWCPRSPW